MQRGWLVRSRRITVTRSNIQSVPRSSFLLQSRSHFRCLNVVFTLRTYKTVNQMYTWDYDRGSGKQPFPPQSILVKCLFALAKHASSAQSNLLSCIVHFPVAICSLARSLTWLLCAPDIVQGALTSLYNIIFRKVTMFTKHNGLCSRGPNLP